MLTFKGIQDSVLTRFNGSMRDQSKEWINYVLAQLWAMDEWTFKQATANVTVTSGSTAVTGLPADVGIIHLLLNQQGAKLTWRPWTEFNLRHYGDVGGAQPWDFTTIGIGPGSQLFVGPPSSETSSLYQLLYERERGFYPSSTLTSETVMPTGTVTVASVTGALSAGSAMIGGRIFNYTGITGLNLTGCTGGFGDFAAGETVTFLNAQAGELYNDTDVPLLPPETHQLLIHGAQAIGQTGENDYSLYLSDDRVQQGLATMRARYLISQRGETLQWGSYELGHFETGGSW